MKTITYRELPVTFQLCKKYKLGDMDIQEFLGVRDNGAPVDRFDVFRNQKDKYYTAWTGDTIIPELKKLRVAWTNCINELLS